jgi:hypothetical protein
VVQASGQSWHSPSSGSHGGPACQFQVIRVVCTPSWSSGRLPLLASRFLKGPRRGMPASRGTAGWHRGTPSNWTSARSPPGSCAPAALRRTYPTFQRGPSGPAASSAWLLRGGPLLSQGKEKRGYRPQRHRTVCTQAQMHACASSPLSMLPRVQPKARGSGGAGEAPPDPLSARPMALTSYPPSSPSPHVTVTPQAVRPAKAGLLHSLTEPSSLTVKV